RGAPSSPVACQRELPGAPEPRDGLPRPERASEREHRGSIPRQDAIQVSRDPFGPRGASSRPFPVRRAPESVPARKKQRDTREGRPRARVWGATTGTPERRRQREGFLLRRRIGHRGGATMSWGGALSKLLEK